MFRKKRTTDSRLDTELRYHFERLIRDLIAEGVEPTEARRRAQLEFGGIEQIKEDCRDVRGRWLEDFFKDLRYSARTLRRSPGFLVVSILSLALGIGANTAIFSLIDAVMLRMLPVSHPEQLMFVNTNAVSMGQIKIARTITFRALERMQERARALKGLCAVSGQRSLAVAWNGQAGLASGEFVSDNFFTMLGVPALMGRTFTAGDGRSDNRIAVIGFGYWQRRFGGDPSVIGRSVAVNNVPFTIVAVTPREFYGTSIDAAADIMMPQAALPQVQAGHISSDSLKATDSAGRVFARIKPGAPVRGAAAELTTIFRQATLETSPPGERDSIAKIWIELSPAGRGFSRIRNRFSEPLKILMVVAALVMLIACTNIATLLLARARARQREIAIRLSLGSSRSRLVRQLMTESLLLSLLGGILGWLLAMWGRGGIVYLANAGAAIPGGWNLRVLAFACGACILNVLLFGAAPALYATRIDIAGAIKSASGGGFGGRLPLARVLVVAQVALSLTLLVGAALFLSTFRNLDRVDLGYNRDRSLLVTIDPSYAGYRGAAAREIDRQIVDRVATIPGVRAVSLMESRLMTGNINMTSIFVPGYLPAKGEDLRNLWVISQKAGAGFFTTSGMRLAAGRDFSSRDDAGAPKVAVINQTMAEHFFAGKDPIGQRVARDRNEAPITVVGVVRDFRIFSVREERQDLIFTPLLQSEGEGKATLWVRTALDPARTAGAIRDAIHSVDAKLPQYEITTVDQQVAGSLSQPRLLAILGSAFGLLALALAAIGLYGVISYEVTRRTREIGVRMAMGAPRGSIWRLIAGETARLTAIGIVLGTAIALLAARAIGSMLYGVTGADLWSFGSAVAVLAAAALIAGILPAQRASRVEPIATLRHD